MSNHYDVIIIGTGAGGGTLAWKLAPTGKKILLLERGDYVPREKKNWDPRAVNLEGLYQTKEKWRDRDGKELHPHTNYYVGGNTKFYGAALFRMRKEDFGEVRHHGGISPAWPISYDELEQAEQLYRVHGNRGEDPTDPHASGPYPHPAVSHEPRIQALSDDFARLGLRPFHVPIGVGLDEKNPRTSACIRCNTCDGFPCLVGAKSDAQTCAVDPALKYPNVTLLTNAKVEKLVTDAAGRRAHQDPEQRCVQPVECFCRTCPARFDEQASLVGKGECEGKADVVGAWQAKPWVLGKASGQFGKRDIDDSDLDRFKKGLWRG